MQMNKAVLAIIVVLIVLGGIYYWYYLRQPEEKNLPFNEGVTQLNAIWGNNGISAKELNDDAALSAIQESRLNSLKGDLTDFKVGLAYYTKTEDIDKLNELAGIEIDLVDASIARKNVLDGVAFLESLNYDPDKMCSNTSKIDNILKDIEDSYTKTNFYNEELASFTASNPGQASSAGIKALTMSTSTPQISDLKGSFNEFKAYC
ncbi:MAG: hypothetical protein AB1467_01965 [Candidatus Diapherotrites archaeon]